MVLPGVVASGHAAAAGGAVRFSASTMKYSRTASGLNMSTDITLCCWVKLAADRNAWSIPMGIGNGSSSYIQFGFNATGTQLVVGAATGGISSSLNLAVGVWEFIALVFHFSTSVNDELWWGTAAPLSTNTGGISAGFADTNTFYFSDDSFGDWLNGSVAAAKIWTAALTQTELEAEMLKYAPQRTSNLWAAYSFQNGPQTVDDSGNGRTLTQVGTPILDAAGPPIT